MDPVENLVRHGRGSLSAHERFDRARNTMKKALDNFVLFSIWYGERMAFDEQYNEESFASDSAELVSEVEEHFSSYMGAAAKARFRIGFSK